MEKLLTKLKRFIAVKPKLPPLKMPPLSVSNIFSQEQNSKSHEQIRKEFENKAWHEWLFNQNVNNPHNILNLVQNPCNRDAAVIKEVLDWWERLKVEEDIHDQFYDEKLVEKLGPDCAAAHFLIDRLASIRFKGDKKWTIGGLPGLTYYENGLPLQAKLQGKFIDAIDCQNFHRYGIRYEGLRYFSGLEHLKYLSLKNQKLIDTKCLQRLAEQNGKTIVYIDLSGCHLDGDDLKPLGEMPALQSVVLSEDCVTQKTLQWLGSLSEKKPNLKLIIEKLERKRNSPSHDFQSYFN